MAEVRVGENETFESALRRFNKKIQQSGILAEARRRDTSGGAAMSMLRDVRASIRAAPKEQQERHSKKACQDARKGRRHLRTLCVDRAQEGT